MKNKNNKISKPKKNNQDFFFEKIEKIDNIKSLMGK